jgi:hypothetical protein
VAFSLPRDDRFAWSVIFGIFEGGKFNYDTLQFEKDDY